MRVAHPPDDTRSSLPRRVGAIEKLQASIYELLTAYDAFTAAHTARIESEHRK